jgi:hypothetical protein
MGRRQRLKARERATRAANSDVETHMRTVARDVAEFGGAAASVPDEALFVVDKAPVKKLVNISFFFFFFFFFKKKFFFVVSCVLGFPHGHF